MLACRIDNKEPVSWILAHFRVKMKARGGKFEMLNIDQDNAFFGNWTASVRNA